MQEGTPTRPQGSYHHGNLKEALVDAYFELLKTIPAEKLSLRKLASQVGVAPTAVYNHFSDKDALMSEIELRCIKHFTAYLRSNSCAEEEPEKRICNLGRAYFQYSVDHPKYFELVFLDETSEESITEELLAAGMAAETEVRDVICALLEKHGVETSQYNTGLGTFACWSMAHGVSLLAAKHVNHAACMEGRWPPEFMLNDREMVKSSFSAISDVLVAGILAAVQKKGV
ncbi:TetR/AcrR family transcriptional regulator [Teredinibacter haidensis]|uniref:TetR/AcrR family transcriptional regulator n=1 Tax=Teredinibacter haidensis TaxID=2731755 RepID=UPI0009490150|nr:TetR/AcrR family transcriptional regulator [Teredinibacter haidensis]